MTTGLLAYPMRVDERGEISGVRIQTSGISGAPIFMAGIFHPSSNPNEEVMLVSLEVPEQRFMPQEPLEYPKKILELEHFKDFSRAFRAVYREEFTDDGVIYFRETPDFRVLRHGRLIGVEMTAFALTHRRAHFSMVRCLAQIVFALPEECKRKLLGTTLGVWIPPFSRLKNFNHVRRRAHELALEVAAYEPFLEGQRGHDFDAGPPSPFPNIGIVTGPSGFSYCAFVNDFGPVTVRAAEHQIEVVGFLPEPYGETKLISVADELIRRHDRDGVKTLVMAFGATDRYGYSYPLEREAFRVLGRALSNGWKPKVNHIQAIYLHLAESDEIFLASCS